MPFDSNKRHRRSIRLLGYDYMQAGIYFVTVCTQGKGQLFGEIISGEMVLNQQGRIADMCWRALPQHFPHITFDAWVLMPNHLHGIIVIGKEVGRGDASAHETGFAGDPPIAAASPTKPIRAQNDLALQDNMDISLGMIHCTAGDASAKLDESSRGNECADASPLRAHGAASGSLGVVVGNFKSVSTRKINAANDNTGNIIWQRNYYEHIIRSGAELGAVRAYIANNPSNWAADIENPMYKP